MNKESSTYLGYGLLALALLAYGIHTKKGWKYYVLVVLFVAPLGGTIGYALGKEKEPAPSTPSTTTTSTFTQPTLPATKVDGYEFDPLQNKLG